MSGRSEAPPSVSGVHPFAMDRDGIIAIGLLTRRDLDQLGPTFDRLWPVEQAPVFEELIEAIDKADAELQERSARPKPVQS